MILYILYIMLWVSNTLLMFGKIKFNAVALLTACFLAILFVTNSGIIGDAIIYKSDFVYKIENFGFEPGYVILKKIFYAFGIVDYNKFLMVSFTFFTFLLYRGLTYFNTDYHCVYAISMGFIFPAFACAIRFYFAFCIFVFALPFLFEEKRRLYVILVMFACSIHYTSVIYLLPLLIPTMTKLSYLVKEDYLFVRKYKIIAALFVICAMYTWIFKQIPFNKLTLEYIMIFYAHIENKLNAYFGTITNMGGFIFVVIYTTNLVYAVKVDKILNHVVLHIEDCCDGLQKINLQKCLLLSRFNMMLNYMSSCFLPLIVLNLVFFRCFFMMTLMNVLLFSEVKHIDCLCKSQKYKLKYLMISIILAWLLPAVAGVNSISPIEVITSSKLYEML